MKNCSTLPYLYSVSEKVLTKNLQQIPNFTFPLLYCHLVRLGTVESILLIFRLLTMLYLRNSATPIAWRQLELLGYLIL